MNLSIVAEDQQNGKAKKRSRSWKKKEPAFPFYQLVAKGERAPLPRKIKKKKQKKTSRGK